LKGNISPSNRWESLVENYPGVSSLHEEISVLIADLARKVRTRFDQRAREIGLTRPQWRILNIVLHVEGVPQSFLVQKMEVEHITVSRLIDNLAKMGWVERRPDPNDKRVKLIFPTEKVRPLLAEIQAIRKAMEDEIFGVLSDRETLTLRKLLHKVNDNYSRLDKVELQNKLHNNN